MYTGLQVWICFSHQQSSRLYVDIQNLNQNVRSRPSVYIHREQTLSQEDSGVCGIKRIGVIICTELDLLPQVRDQMTDLLQH